MSKKIVVLAAFLLTVFCSGAALASDVQITNKAGFDFYEVHFAPAHSANWGEDVLNMNVILNNETVTVHWDKGDQDLYNLMVIDEQGHKFYWSKLNLKEVSRITLKPESHADLQ